MGLELFCLLNFEVCMIVVEEVSKKVLKCLVGIIFFVIGVVEILFICWELLILKK